MPASQTTTVPAPVNPPDALPALPPLRDYQAQAVSAVMARLATEPATYLELPTGGGKTRILAELAGRARRGRVLAVAHTDILVEQLARGIGADGIVKAARDDTSANIVAASIQTLAVPGRLERVLDDPAGPVSLLLVDEAHHATAATWRRVLSAVYSRGGKSVGVTATPYRADGGDIDELFGAPAFARSIVDLQHAGHLVPMTWRVARVGELDLSAVKVSAGDYAAGALGDAFTDQILASMATKIHRLVGGRRTVVYTPTVDTAEVLAIELIRAGMPAAAISGTTERAERDRVLAVWRAGETQTVVNCQLLTEGFDLPGIEAVVIARPTRSQALYVQMVGRGLRPAPGKSDCLVIDVAGNPDLADPNQVILPMIAGVRTADDLDELVTESEPGRSRESEQETRLMAGMSESVWIWRHVAQVGVPGDFFYAPLDASKVAVIGVHPESGLAHTWALDTKTRVVTWRSEVASSPRRAVREVSKQLSGEERRSLSRRNADWRYRDASDKQLSLLEKIDPLAAAKAKTEGWNMGRAAEAINDVFAARAIRTALGGGR